MVYRTAPFSMTLNAPTQISRSRHYLTLNISETIRDKDSYYEILTHAPFKGVISNNLFE